MPQADTHPPYTIKQASQRLKLSRNRVQEVVSAGIITGHKDENGRWLLDHASVEAYHKAPRKCGFPFGAYREGGKPGGGKMVRGRTP